jgi:predicted alpha/beta-hydrolase family hydrolase
VKVGLLLAPGAGSASDHPTLVAIDAAASSLGVDVVRMDFPYRKAGRRAPDRQGVLVEAVRSEAASLLERCDLVVLGGRSMGGRMCSLALSEGLSENEPTPGLGQPAGLVLISYPLHPPGKPEQLRTGHFDRIQVPCLFISGSKDAFCTPEELRSTTSAIPAPVTHVFVEGRDHSLRGCDDSVAARVVEWISALAFDLA